MFLTLAVNAESAKVMQLSYDDSSSVIFIGTERLSETEKEPLNYVKL